MIYRIGVKELLQAQAALFVAIALQLISRQLGTSLVPESHSLIIGAEFVLAVLIGFTAFFHNERNKSIHHATAIVMLALISAVNISDLGFVLKALIVTHSIVDGTQLLASAIAIFLTNIIVFALWYWEIDSPGLTRTKWSKHDKNFQFTQHDKPAEFPEWYPELSDYLFMSITNALNFAPADTRPLSRQAKSLMAAQAMVSIFTLALVVARSVNVLGT